MEMAELLKILACPSCHHSLEELPDGLLCSHCKVVYPIEDEIPVLLIDHAIPLDKWKKENAS